MKTAIVILNWNTKGYLQTFLPGLIASTEGMDAEVIVADSASTDGSLEMLYHEFPTVRQIRLPSVRFVWTRTTGSPEATTAPSRRWRPTIMSSSIPTSRCRRTG